MGQGDPFLEDLVRDTVNRDWLIISLMFLATAYVLVRLIYGKYWRRYRQAVIYNQEAQKLMVEKNVILLQTAFMLNILASLSMGLFLFIFLDHFGWSGFLPGKAAGWGLVSIFVMIVTSLKYVLVNLLGRSADKPAAAAMVNHHWLINYKNFGLFLLPVSAAAVFSNPQLNTLFIILGLVIIAFMLIINYIKAFTILFQHRISIYYGILYLCTLEILPVLILIKLVRFLLAH